MSTTPHSAAIIDSVTCNGCTKLIALSEVRKYGLGNQADGYRCLECRTLFIKARDAMQDGLSLMLSDRPVEEVKCRSCQKTYEQLYWETNGTCRWFCHIKDQEFALICGACSDAYARKATALYRNTKFEHKAKLRGSK